jgi:hypothetical protein
MKRMKTFLLSGAVAVGLFAIIGASPALAAGKPGGGSTSASCPKGDAGLQPDPSVGASYSTDAAGVTTYQLFSQDQDAVDGVPGLIKYCVYPHDATGAPTVTVDANGGSAADVPWIASTSSKKPYNFSFGRPGGNSATNIWFDQDDETTLMGTADWGSGSTPPVPTTQDIVLHVADPSLCGSSSSGTCFVKPSAPVCSDGTGALQDAYNAIPFSFPNCKPPPSFAFEANLASEFGDGVLLGKGGTLQSMTVDFQSYGCGNSGHWYTGTSAPCVTTPGQTFKIPDSPGQPGSGGITAHIYAVNPTTGAVGAEIAHSTIDPDIPYRPSANSEAGPLGCKGGAVPPQIEADSRFLDEYGHCVFSKSVPLTFTGFTINTANYPSGHTFAAGEQVVWTISFNTTHAGFFPIGTSPTPACPAGAGCGYDSLNVGTYRYPGSPYAGTDITATDPDPTDQSYYRFNGNLVEEDNGSCLQCTPQLFAHDLLPLGEIVTVPVAP